ncbi:MAG: copper chaperone PCu(A)C [Xanthomonadales bacterium]|nr:copper chaperone PCu(A)C [Xanthomonadales bacterium]
MNARLWVLGLLLAIPLSPSVQAAPAGEPALTIDSARINPAPASAPVRAGFAQLHNPSTHEVVIDAMRSPAFAKVELHEMHVRDGLMQMRPVAVLRIPAQQSASLAPGGLHLMLYQPKSVLERGDRAPIEFLSGATVVGSAEFVVAAPEDLPKAAATASESMD